MADPNEDLQLGGGAPPTSPLGGPSLEAEERAMRKGKGRMVAAMVVAGLGAVVGLILYMSSGGDDAYAVFGRNVNGLDRQHFDRFWNCTLQGYDTALLKSDQDLREQLHKRAGIGRDRFAALVRDECMPHLADMEPALQSLIPPEDMQPAVRDLVDAVNDLRGGFSDYIAHLDQVESYDREAAAATGPVGRIAKGWYDYRKTLSELNKTLKEKLEP